MVARKFIVRYNDCDFDVEYDTDDGFEVFKFQLFSLTSIPPDEQKIFGGDADRPVSDESDLIFVPDKLRLVSLNDEVGVGVQGESMNRGAESVLYHDEFARKLQVGNQAKKEVDRESPNRDAQLTLSDEELAQILQAEEEALLLQQFVADEDGVQMEQTLQPYIEQVLMYEDPRRQETARSTAPMDELEEKALVSLAKEGNFKPSKSEQDHAFLLQLLYWFKQSFRWVDAPLCDGCGNKTLSHGMTVALPSEVLYGASRVELYRCNFCSRTTRFPRYNDPLKLVETRKGRCGEWANCFTLYCRSLGYDSRLIMDFTDHVWTECFSDLLGRWMHLDPCEGVYDKPLLYEEGYFLQLILIKYLIISFTVLVHLGELLYPCLINIKCLTSHIYRSWNKKLNYVIAVAKDGVYDVTKRYTRKWHEVLSRRNITTEPVLSVVLSNMTRECRKDFASQVLSVLEDRDREEMEALERDFRFKNEASISLPGRQSGDKRWRILRQEYGSDVSCSLSCSASSVRLCIDEHVAKIYNAFYPLLLQFVESSLSKFEVVKALEIFKGILLDLRKTSFKLRRTSIKSHSGGAQLFMRSFDEFLDALSLKSELDADGMVNRFLASDPVRTSLALPVALDALDTMIQNLSTCNELSKDSLSLPLLKLNRIHSGSVLASGEELPLGIVTSAFDGIQLSKWEEPNGARGCWIIYKVFNNQMHELVAYELMSANDAPERDPMDWVLEGSDDEGSSWHVLDEQTSQMFENRFQRRIFTIKSTSLLSNMFRFRFLTVCDVQATSRLQLGSIDLYARRSS